MVEDLCCLSSVVVHTFKLQYLCNAQTDFNQTSSVAYIRLGNNDMMFL